jgi:hypothetical protein
MSEFSNRPYVCGHCQICRSCLLPLVNPCNPRFSRGLVIRKGLRSNTCLECRTNFRIPPAILRKYSSERIIDFSRRASGEVAVSCSPHKVLTGTEPLKQTLGSSTKSKHFNRSISHCRYLTINDTFPAYGRDQNTKHS